MSYTDEFYIIKEVVDKCISRSEEIGGNFFNEELVPDKMADFEKTSGYEGKIFWKAIPSEVSDEQLAALEAFVKAPLPASYKYFLQHRHFLKLYFGELYAMFYRSVPDKWLETMQEQISMGREDVVNDSYIPIGRVADDYGVICFDTSGTAPDYPVVWFDFEHMPEKPKPVAENFLALFGAFKADLETKLQVVKLMRS